MTRCSNGSDITWFVSLILFSFLILSYFKDLNIDKDKKVNFNVYEKFYILLILILASILRFYKIKFHSFHLDELFWLSQAKGVLDGTVKSPFGFIGDQPSNMPVYPVALLLAFLKDGYLAVRLPGVLYSLLSILIILYFLKESFNKKTVALIGLTLLSTSIWDIHMSQLGWNNVNLNPFLISGTIFFLYRGIKNYSVRDIFLCGVFLGLSINLLYITSLGLIVVIFYFIYHLIFNKRRFSVISLLIILIVSTFVFCSPTLVKINKYGSQSLNKHKFFINENINFAKDKGIIRYYGEQIKLAIKDFAFDRNKYQIIGLWSITLEPIVIIFLIIGLFYTLKSFYKPESLLILLTFIVMFIPIVLLYRGASFWREYGFLPSIYILAAIGVYSISNLLAKPPILNSYSWVLLSLILGVYFFSFVYYFNQYRKSVLLHEVDVYENYCKRTANYIDNNISTNTLILLPNEMCRELISIVLLQKYRYATYDSYEDINRYFKTDPKTTIVKISEGGYSSQFSKLNPLPVFKNNLINYYNLKPYIIRGENGKVYSVLFQ